MDILASIIKVLFGSKADKDRKQIEPYIEKIKAVYPSIEALSNDELRARSEAPEKADRRFHRRDEAHIVELKAILEKPETQLEEKEKISKEIDETTKRIDEKIEEVLDQNSPRGVRIHEGYGAPLRPERYGRGDGQRFRPQSRRNEGFRHHRGRPRPSTPPTGWPAATT